MTMTIGGRLSEYLALSEHTAYIGRMFFFPTWQVGFVTDWRGMV
jgi:hypothetical protein